MRLTKSNYYGKNANMQYLGYSQYKDFVGTIGNVGCEYKALAKLKGDYIQEQSKDMLLGSYVDSAWDGTLDKFKEKHPEMFLKTGELKADFRKAQQAFERTKRDDLFCLYMSGQKQKIMTANFLGYDWKIRMDSYHPTKCIVDLKYVKDIREKSWIRDLGEYINFVDNYGYNLQGAIYQKIVELNTGYKLPFYLCVVDKKSTPEIAIIQVPQHKLDEALLGIESNVKRIVALKKGEIQPDKCTMCDYCLENKVIETPILSTSLI